MRVWLWLLLVLCSPLQLAAAADTATATQTASERPPAWRIKLEGPVGPATADHVLRALDEAQAAKAPLVLLHIDTPGGLDNAMRDMIRGILASSIPVVGYVAPSGARAASAGTYLLYACHLAAMAPATNLGAATPVQIGGPSMPEMPADPSEDKPAEQPAPKSDMERKILNDAVAYIESLAELRGRNAEWAVKAVREGASLSAGQALEKGVINIVAADEADLLRQLHGRELVLSDEPGAPGLTLDTEGLAVHEQPMDWRSAFLAVITNPNIAYMLMLIGIYGLIFEFSNPGFGLPGVLGAVSLLLAMYALQMLPVSYVGLALIVLGVGLMAAEAFAPSFGILGLGGIAAFVMGSIMLMDTRLPGYQIAMPLIVAFAVFSAGLLVFALGMVLKARKQAVVSGLQHLVGASARVARVHDGVPMIHLDGELWQVQSEQPLQLNDEVTVTQATGVVLRVDKNTRREE